MGLLTASVKFGLATCGVSVRDLFSLGGELGLYVLAELSLGYPWATSWELLVGILSWVRRNKASVVCILAVYWHGRPGIRQV